MTSRADNENLSRARVPVSVASALRGEPRRIFALAKQVWTKVRTDPVLRLSLIGLLFVDFAFIAANQVALAFALSPKLQNALNIHIVAPVSPAFSVSDDWSVPEMTDYAKAAIIAALLFLCGRRHRQPIYLSGAAAFLMILADDALTIHETVGGYLAARYSVPFAFGLRPQDIGELIVYAAWMVAGGALGLYGLIGSTAAHIRAAMLFAAVIGLLAFFSVVVDMAEIPIYWQFRRAALMIGVVEDGGEMVALTIALILALTLWRHPGLVASESAA